MKTKKFNEYIQYIKENSEDLTAEQKKDNIKSIFDQFVVKIGKNDSWLENNHGRVIFQEWLNGRRSIWIEIQEYDLNRLFFQKAFEDEDMDDSYGADFYININHSNIDETINELVDIYKVLVNINADASAIWIKYGDTRTKTVENLKAAVNFVRNRETLAKKKIEK